MTRAILFFTSIAIAVAPGSGGAITPSDSNLSKREILEFYPDWVPFKNKHGDELGEFVDVNKPKAKVKKRLALPMNFLMRRLSDDYEDIGQGEAEGDEDYEKKEWSDLHRDIKNVSLPRVTSNTSDIDGVLEIITQESPSLANDINNSIPKQRDVNKDESYEDNVESEEENTTTHAPNLEKEEEYTTPPATPEHRVSIVENREPKQQQQQQQDDDYDDVEDEPESTTKKSEVSEEEQRENERRKKIILDSVDQLKQRHEEEQKAISEKAKDDDFNTEFTTKNRQSTKGRSNYKQWQRVKTTTPDYDEYEDLSWSDKYNINIQRKTTTEDPYKEILTSPITQEVTTETATRISTRQTVTTTEKNKEPVPMRYSVFRNPNLFIVDEDEHDEHSKKKKITHKKSNIPRRFSSKYSSPSPGSIESEENNIYPTLQTTENTEKPILYFPRIKMSTQKKLKPTATTKAASDSYVAETVEDKLTRTTQPISYSETSPAETTHKYTTTDDTTSTEKDDESEDQTSTTGVEDLTSAAEDNGPSGAAETINVETVTDVVPASSDHAKDEPKEYHVEKGGGHEHHSSHEEEHEEHGKKAYEGLHKDSKTKKGHHDKEDHLGKYEDHGGHDKKHHDETGHYGAHHHEEQGKKHAKYEESGKHSKGHSTKGSHDIHKKEEYEKKVEFFEEEGDSGEEEKHGGYHNEKQHKLGGEFKKGNLQNEHHEKKKGESGHFVKGGHHDVKKGHKSSGGHESHGKHGGAQHGAGGHQGGKKWVYHHGFPAKNANLIVIDRRGDRYMHGPAYYG